MTRKDYTVLAADLKVLRDRIVANGDMHGHEIFTETVDVIIANLKRENGRFDRDRFMTAVGF
jgi:hypothetical protein